MVKNLKRLKWLLVLFFVVRGFLFAQEKSPTGHDANLPPATIHPLKLNGIENFYQLSDKIYSGSAPEGETAFAGLRALGIQTIITVDGSKPDVETAHKYGIRYVHLPVGYDGVPTSQALRLVKAAENLPGPILVHCHHGLHRGPAGAAVVCMGMEGWTPGQAEAWLKLAGTATNYTGLYKSVELFRAPSAEVLNAVSGDFPEQTEVSPLAEVMIQVDERFDHLKLVKKAGYQKVAANPELDGAQEALLLDELFKELRRSNLREKRGKDFQERLDRAEQAAAALQATLQKTPLDVAAVDVAFQRSADSCAGCHKAHRN